MALQIRVKWMDNLVNDAEKIHTGNKMDYISHNINKNESQGDWKHLLKKTLTLWEENVA